MNIRNSDVKKQIQSQLLQKEEYLPRLVGRCGDGFGNLYADGVRTKVYVRIGEANAVPVYNSRVAVDNDMWVVVGVERPNSSYQILSTYSDSPAGDASGAFAGGFAPASRYEWLANGGGQDPLYVHNRAITYLNIYMTDPPGMSVFLTRGNIVNSSGVIMEIPDATFDHTPYIPSTSDKALLVLHTIDEDGNNVITIGSEVDIDSLMPLGDRFANAPAIPANTIWIRGLVRVYNGQEKVQEGRSSTDIIDLRFTGYNDWTASGTGGNLEWQIDGALAVMDDAASPILITKDTSISAVYLYCEDLGTAGSTIIDIILNGPSPDSIFSSPSPDYPTLAYNDSNEWVKVIPQVTDFVEGDILSLDITQVATGAGSMRVILQVAGSGSTALTPKETFITIPVFFPKTQTNWNTISAASASQYYALSSGAQNDLMTWDLEIPGGTYSIHLMHFKDTNRGIYTFSIDSVNVGTIDGNAASAISASNITGIAITNTPGIYKTLQVKMATTSGAGYYGVIFGIWLERTGD